MAFRITFPNFIVAGQVLVYHLVSKDPKMKYVLELYSLGNLLFTIVCLAFSYNIVFPMYKG